MVRRPQRFNFRLWIEGAVASSYYRITVGVSFLPPVIFSFLNRHQSPSDSIRIRQEMHSHGGRKATRSSAVPCHIRLNVISLSVPHWQELIRSSYLLFYGANMNTVLKIILSTRELRYGKRSTSDVNQLCRGCCSASEMYIFLNWFDFKFQSNKAFLKRIPQISF